MSGINKFFLIGRLGQTPTRMETKKGGVFCRLSIAINEGAGNDESRRKTNWFSVHVFGHQAELALQYLNKGREVCVEGHFDNAPTEALDASGKKLWRTWFRADRVTFLGSASGSREVSMDELPTFEEVEHSETTAHA